jgi:hypothetical protein
MACSLPSADILALCLELAGYDLNTSIAAIMRHSEAAGSMQGWCAGHDEVVLASILYWLGSDLGLYELGPGQWPPPALEGIPLRAWVQPILERQSAYFNDEGESWGPVPGGELECNRQCRALLAAPRRWTPAGLHLLVEELGLARLAGLCTCRLLPEPGACPLGFCWRSY